MTGDSSFTWLRPATITESFFHATRKRGPFITVYGLTLRSKVPLTDDLIKRALQHMFRKVNTLRMCFRVRGDTLWACEMNRDEINFQVTDTKDVIEALESLLQYSFPTTEGPLWCARLLPSEAASRCVRPELAADFPHTRLLLMANHHIIADGTTNLFITDAFLRILDDVVTGTVVDDTIQLGRSVMGEETEAIIDAKVAELLKDQDQLRKMLDEHKRQKKEEKLIPRAYPMPADPNFKVQTILTDVDRETTQNFIKKCKKEGVTVNSGLAAVLNVSLVDFVQEGALEQDEYHVKEQHTVSVRRYWSGDTAGTLGMHMLFFCNTTSTPAKWRDTFWEHARATHESIGQGLKNKGPVMYGAIFKLGSQEKGIDTVSDGRPYSECDYGLANMGNAHNLVKAERRHVHLTHLIRTTSCVNNPMHNFIHTLHGRFMHSLTYPNDILTRQRAQKLVDQIFENLKTVTRE